MRRARILTGLLGALGFLYATVVASEAATPPKPPELAVVKTWGDLLKQPEIKLSGGTLVRLGMAADRAPVYGGVIVYLLTEAQPDNEQTVEIDDCLGPCKLMFVEGLEIELENTKVAKAERAISGLRPGRLYLYAQIVPLHREGEVRFSLVEGSTQPSGPGLSTCAVGRIQAGPQISPWSLFGEPHALTELVQAFEPELHVSFRCGMPALPRLCGTRPCAYKPNDAQTVLEYANEPLPPVWGDAQGLPPPDEKTLAAWRAYVPKLSDEDFEVRDAASRALAAAGSQALDFLQTELRRSEEPEARLRLQTLVRHFHPALTLTQNASCLILRSEQVFEFEYDPEPFLVRWWVNGQPVAARGDLDGAMVERSSGLEEVRGVRLKLELDPSALDLKPGDRLGVQVAYCPHGTREIGPQILAELQRAERAAEPAFETGPWLSNRLEFTYRAGDFPEPKETDEGEALEAADADQ